MTDPNLLTPDLVVLAISNGMLDASLPALSQVIQRRKEIVAADTANRLVAGDRFLSVNITPKKLAGVEFEFQRHDGQWIVVTFVNAWDRPSNYKSQLNLRASHVGTITRKVA